MALRISIVIPSLNGTTLPRALDAIADQTRQPDEVIVVGRDEAGVLKQYPHVHFIDTGTPLCAAGARNWGIKAAQGDVIAFTDADCIPAEDWLAQHEKCQIVGEKIVGGSVALAGSNYWAQADNVSMFHDFVETNRPGYRRHLPTLNLSVSRNVFEKVGDMDESISGATAEDSDWSVRMRQAGYQLYFEPRAIVQHAPTRTRWGDLITHWRNRGRNSIIVRLRYSEDFKTPKFAKSAFWLLFLSPFIAAAVTACIYVKPIFWRHWRYLPIVYVSKIVYCVGAADTVRKGLPDR